VEGVRLVAAREVRALALTERVVGPGVLPAFGAGESIYPTAGRCGLMAESRTSGVAPESLAPVYLRAANFIKAPQTRVIPGITDDRVPGASIPS